MVRSATVITLKGVGKNYGKEVVLKDISFEIQPKELVCITGPSGAGKSTLIHIMIGAESVSKGTVSVDRAKLTDLPAPVLQLFRRRVGVVFQDYKLLWNNTVFETVAFPLEVRGASDAFIRKRVGEVLEEMGLSARANTLASALSGGEKARTAIARAIVHDPVIVFADEPTGNLDPEQTESVLELFKRVHEAGTTVVLATHEVDIVDSLQTRVIHLKNGVVERDSVGGYVRGKAKEKKARAAKHEVFVESEEESGGSKIKITAINGQ
jgi:cell division transport system ATP-binding protein